MAALLPSTGEAAASYLKRVKVEAIRGFASCENSHAYSSPLFLRRLLEVQRSDLGHNTKQTCSSHTMLLLPDQTYDKEDECFLSILCAECRYHFHVQIYKGHNGALDDSSHPGHMLLPVPQEFLGNHQGHTHKTDDSQFICAVEDCFYMVKLSVMQPKLSIEQINKLQDDHRMLLNLQRARAEDPQRYQDVPDTWATGSTVPTLVKYIEDRLAKPAGHVLKIKKRNKKFRVAFGDDLNDLLRSLGFEERIDDEGEECWYITEPEAVPAGRPTPVHTRRAHIQDILEELRTLLPLNNTLAWEKLTNTFSGYLPRRDIDPATTRGLSVADTTLLGCLREFSPQSFSWAAILLAGLCPSRRDEFLDAGIRCIQERSEEASLNIIMYRSKFDEIPFVDPQVQAAFEFFGASLKDSKDTDRILNKYRTMVEADTSNSFRSKASQHLEVISNHLGADLLGEVARGDSLATPSIRPGSRRMSIASASRLLKVDSNYSADLIRDFAGNVDDRIDRGKVIEALEVLAELKEQQRQHEEAQSLRDSADFLRATNNVEVGQVDKPVTTDQATAGTATCATTPPGLKNIGNTCYLNSLLQYFYNVKAVREMVLNYDQIQLDLNDSAVHSRRTGGNGTRVTTEEAIVARQFIQELRRLFLELQATTGAAATPSQKLANTALSSAKEILTLKSQNQPPPLPARPSPAPPKESASVNVNVEPVNETHDFESSASSRTLVNEIENALADVPSTEKQINNGAYSPTRHIRELSPEDRALSDTVEHVEDVTMEDPRVQPPLSLEQKIAEVARRLEQSDRSGTSQQDVEEIIGNILEHLMRAIRPNGPMKSKPDLQADKVTELFFTTIVNSTIRTKAEAERDTLVPSVDEHILNEEVVPERWITAFPHPDKEHKMKNNMYEALDRYFSYELLADGDLARYTTIRALPPIVHICIQRSDASGVKNKNPVIIPEVLYLDRYMEADTGSRLWNTRRRVWAIKERIKELESRYSVENVLKAPGSQSWNTHATDRAQVGDNPRSEELIDLKNELWQDMPPRSKRTLDTAQLSESVEAKPVKRRSVSRDDDNTSPKFADTLWEAGRQADETNSTELGHLRKEQADAFDCMKQHKYCLHAMICHSGGMNAGHYWVWVRDFKKQVWYKYNDSLVTEDSRDSQQVIDELNTSGDPYYVAYVRDTLKDELVEVPRYTERTEDDVDMINVSEVELEVIDSIVIDTPAQPANSPVNTATEINVGEAVPLELQS
ncbi:cysteine proteinase [Xylaria intraflava]|nr:cysteine proteinase [Xylaria intraflava]